MHRQTSSKPYGDVVLVLLNSFQQDAAAPASPKAKAAPAKKAEEEDDDDLFGDDGDGEDDEAAAAKKEKKKPIERSQVVIEVKPWEAETDLEELAKKIKATKIEGLNWGEGHKLVPVAFGIKKLLGLATAATLG